MWLQAGGCGPRQVTVIIRKYSVAGLRPLRCCRVETGGPAVCGSKQVAVAPGKWLWLQAGGCGSRQVTVIIRK